MITNRIILLLLLLIIGCTPTKYSILIDNELDNIDFSNYLLKIIPISALDYQNDNLVNKTYFYLKSNQNSELRDYLDNIETRDIGSSYYFANSLYFISKSKYKDALANLQKIDTTKFNPIRELLIVDLNYEINYELGLKDFKRYLNEYQTLIDKYPDNNLLKKIIGIRLRFIRYNY